MRFNTLLRVSLFFFFFFLFAFSYDVASFVIPGMYVFGDSLVDVGNNNYINLSLAKADFPHNGIDFPTKKPTGRFCNGKNVVDLLAEKVGLPYPPPYLSIASTLNKSQLLIKGVNFASGGSGIMNETNSYMFVLSLAKQVDYFEAVNRALNERLGFYGASQHFSKSIFMFETGSNDIFAYFGSENLRNKTTPEQYMNLMANTFARQLKRLYNLGARKFVIVGVGVIGCIPTLRSRNKEENCNEELNKWPLKFNEALKSMLSSFEGIKYSYFDGYSVMQNVIQKPKAYGFSEIKAACCGRGKLKAEAPCLPFSSYCNNRSDHLFWDSSHPTEAAHRIFVDYIFNGPLQYTFPLNLKTLIAL